MSPSRRAAPAPNTIMTPKELAQYLRIHLSTVYRLVAGGKIPYFRVGGGYRFTEEEITKWMANRRVPPHDAK